MVLKYLEKSMELRHRSYLALIFGFFLTLIGFFISWVFFSETISIAMIFIITFLMVPLIMKMVRLKSFRKNRGFWAFIVDNWDVFQVYLYSFFGVFLGFIVIGATQFYNVTLYNELFAFQIKFLKIGQDLSVDAVNNFVQANVIISSQQFFSILSSNLGVLIVCFILSFFYGASAVFLVILNASVLANFVMYVIRALQITSGQAGYVFLFFMIHLIPEISGFLLAAIAGGVVSKAIITEKRSKGLEKKRFRDAIYILVGAIFLIIVGAVLEVFVTARLFQVFF